MPRGKKDDGDASNEDSCDALPRQTVVRMVKELLQADERMEKEALDMFRACCAEFLDMITSEANDVMEKAARKTMTPEHVFQALRDLELTEYIEGCEGAVEEWDVTNNKRKNFRAKGKASWQRMMDSAGLTEAELAKQQQDLFSAAAGKS